MTDNEIALTAAIAVPLWAAAIGVWMPVLGLSFGRLTPVLERAFAGIAAGVEWVLRKLGISN